MADRFYYSAINRPIGYATVPAGYQLEPDHSYSPKSLWGVLSYDRALTVREMESYELLDLQFFDEYPAGTEFVYDEERFRVTHHTEYGVICVLVEWLESWKTDKCKQLYENFVGARDHKKRAGMAKCSA